MDSIGQQALIILGGCILAAILWVVKETRDHGSDLAVIKNTIDEQIMPELKRARDVGHELRNLIHGVQTQIAVAKAEWDGEERRKIEAND